MKNFDEIKTLIEDLEIDDMAQWVFDTESTAGIDELINYFEEV